MADNRLVVLEKAESLAMALSRDGRTREVATELMALAVTERAEVVEHLVARSAACRRADAPMGATGGGYV